MPHRRRRISAEPEQIISQRRDLPSRVGTESKQPLRMCLDRRAHRRA